MRFLFFTLICIFSSAFQTAHAQGRPVFGWPIDCKINEDCWFLNYVDMDKRPNEFSDPFCNKRGYDDHKGTDIAVKSGQSLDDGVSVFAAADGKILRMRDGEPDRFPTKIDLEVVKRVQKECGNAVLIDHGSSIETIYCHLKKDSITVKIGDEVKKGDKIGEVGLSGLTEFPHLHFGITWEGAVMDPFTGRANTQDCQENAASAIIKTLWEDDIPYTETSLYNAGFYNAEPLLSEIDKGDHSLDRININQDALAFWFTGFGLKRNDRVTLTIIDPNGNTFATYKVTQESTRARQFYYAGKRVADTPLQVGIYKGQALIERDGIEGLEEYIIERQIEVFDDN